MNVNFSRVISRPLHIQQVPTTDRLTNATNRPREERQSYDESKLETEARGTLPKDTFGRQDGPGSYASLNLIYLFQYKNVRHDHMVCGGRRRYSRLHNHS